MWIGVQSLFLLPLMLFGNVRGSYEDIVCNHTTEFYDRDKVEETWMELGLPVPAENKEVFQEDWIRWVAKKENQSRLLQKIKSQVVEGGLDSSRELSLMLVSLESALANWNETYASETSTVLGAGGKSQWDVLTCYIRKHRNEEINEDNVEARIQELREEEKAHKDEARELVLQAGGEAIGAGAFAAGGMEIPALYEGVQASRHLVQGCKEYNEGVRCQREADELEQRYTNEDEQSEKKWWKFWK